MSNPRTFKLFHQFESDVLGRISLHIDEEPVTPFEVHVDLGRGFDRDYFDFLKSIVGSEKGLGGVRKQGFNSVMPGHITLTMVDTMRSAKVAQDRAIHAVQRLRTYMERRANFRPVLAVDSDVDSYSR